jgi:hypothetical protein
MDRQRAAELATRWVQAHRENQQDAQACYEWFRFELMSLLTDETTAGVARVDGAPVVLVCDAGALVVLRAVHEGEQMVIAAQALVLGKVTSFELKSTIGPLETTPARRRVWTISSAVAAIDVETEEAFTAAFASGRAPSTGELVMREFAHRLGWRIPEEDRALEEL